MLQLAKGILLIPLALLFWYLSWCFFRFAFGAPLQLIFDDWGWEIGFYLACLAMLVLALEGGRRGRRLYIESSYYDNAFTQSTSVRSYSYVYGDPAAAAYYIESFVMLAPQASLAVLAAFRSFAPVERSAIEAAANILEQLKRSRKWTPVSRFAGQGAALFILSRMELIWTESKTGETEIRYPAGNS